MVVFFTPVVSWTALKGKSGYICFYFCRLIFSLTTYDFLLFKNSDSFTIFNLWLSDFNFTCVKDFIFVNFCVETSLISLFLETGLFLISFVFWFNDRFLHENIKFCTQNGDWWPRNYLLHKCIVKWIFLKVWYDKMHKLVFLIYFY